MTTATSPGCPIVAPVAGRPEQCGRLLAETRYACDRHVGRLRRALSDVGPLYDALRDALVPSQRDGERVTVSKSPPAPLSLEARAVQEDMTRLCLAAEREYRARRGWSRLPRRGRERQSLVGSAMWLSTHLDDIAETPIVLELAALLRVTSTARRVLGLDMLVHKLPAPCPTCDHMSLERRDGDSYVQCRVCRRWFDEDDYKRLVLILASDYA